MKIDGKHLWKRRKKSILAVIAVVTTTAIGCGIWYAVGHSNKEPVYVFPFQYIGLPRPILGNGGEDKKSPLTNVRGQIPFVFRG